MSRNAKWYASCFIMTTPFLLMYHIDMVSIWLGHIGISFESIGVSEYWFWIVGYLSGGLHMFLHDRMFSNGNTDNDIEKHLIG